MDIGDGEVLQRLAERRLAPAKMQMASKGRRQRRQTIVVAATWASSELMTNSASS
jgi:hypothetical protein